MDDEGMRLRHPQNLGTVERVIRVLGGLGASIVGFLMLHPLPGTFLIGLASVTLLLLGIDFFISGVTGYCPLYRCLGWSTAKNSHRHLWRSTSR